MSKIETPEVEITVEETPAPSRRRKIAAVVATTTTSIALTIGAQVLTAVISARIENAILKPDQKPTV
jgi:hypothetical protein